MFKKFLKGESRAGLIAAAMSIAVAIVLSVTIVAINKADDVEEVVSSGSVVSAQNLTKVNSNITSYTQGVITRQVIQCIDGTEVVNTLTDAEKENFYTLLQEEVVNQLLAEGLDYSDEDELSCKVIEITEALLSGVTEEDMDDISSMLASIQSGYDDYKISLKESISALQVRVALLEVASSQVPEVEDNSEKYIEEIAVLENSVTNISSSVDSLRDKQNSIYDSLQNQINELASTLAELGFEYVEADYQNKLDEITAAGKDVDELREKLNVITNQVTEYQNSIDAKLLSINETINSLTNKVTTSTASTGADISGLQSEISSIKSTMVNLVSADDLNAVVIELQNRIASVAAGGDGSELTDIQNDIATLQGQYISIKSQCDSIESDLSSLSSSLVSGYATKAELQSIQSTISSLSTSVNNLSTLYSAQSNTLSSLEARIAALESDTAELLSDVATLKTNVAANRNSISSISLDVSNLTTRMSTIESRVGTIESSVSSLTSGLSNVEDAIDSLTPDVEANTSDISDIQSDISDIQDMLDDYTIWQDANGDLWITYGTGDSAITKKLVYAQ